MDKKTPFHSLHKLNGAKLVPFAGYEMPIQYRQGVNFEHNHVRNKVGVFDVSHMGQIIISGIHATQFVQKITCNNLDKLFPGKVQYSCMLNNNAGIIDDLLIYCFDYQKYMLVVNAANHIKDLQWILENNQFDCEVIDRTSSNGLLAVQGPLAKDFLQLFTDVKLDEIPFYNFTTGQIADCKDVIISNTGYTGSSGFELYVKKDDCIKLWKKLFSINYDIEPIGLAARDTLRLEMGYCLHGNDISENHSPIESGLSWIVSKNKNFIGSKSISQQIKKGIDKCLIGFIMIDRGIPRKSYHIFNSRNEIVGEVTSGTMSPSLKIGIGMGYISNKDFKIGDLIYILIREKKVKAKIVKTPFYVK